VYDAVLRDPAFFRFLLCIDQELAGETRRAGCQHCEGPLHVSDFPRKPRGCPASVIAEYSSRFSFTCGRCDQRTTTVSVRFLGRRVYVAAVLMLSSPPQGHAAQRCSALLSIPRRTLMRWRRWWTQDFVRTQFWRAARSRFVPPIAHAELPNSLLDRFKVGSSPIDRLARALRFLAPLSMRSMIK
jgi:hypothetical protein